MDEIKFGSSQVCVLYDYINSNGVWQEKENPAWHYIEPNHQKAWDFIRKQRDDIEARADRRNARIMWRGLATRPIEVNNYAEMMSLASATWVDRGTPNILELTDDELNLLQRILRWAARR